MSALLLEGVTKSFGGVRAVADVTLRALKGRITGLIGPNGAGKTTLINLITGTLKLTSGRITLGENDLTEEEPDIIARRGVSRTFQNIRLLPQANRSRKMSCSDFTARKRRRCSRVYWDLARRVVRPER